MHVWLVGHHTVPDWHDRQVDPSQDVQLLGHSNKKKEYRNISTNLLNTRARKVFS